MESKVGKKRVAFLTTFFEAKSGFSLIAVTETLIRMLLDNGYMPIVLVQDNFEEVEPPSVWNKQVVDLRPVIPFLHLTGDTHPDFEQRVTKVEDALEENLRDVDVCITQDIVLMDTYKEHNIAMRRVAARHPEILWLHWIHSVPMQRAQANYPLNCRTTMPPGYVVYPNSHDLSYVQRAYNMAGREERAVATRAGHSIDPLLLWPYDELTKTIVRATDMLEGDVVMVYPVRLDRGKQLEKIVRLASGVRKAGMGPRVVIVDWQSAGKKFQTYIEDLKELARVLDVGDCTFFTSRLDDRFSQGAPRQVVIELMTLSNVYVHPSRVETYSLTVHEAAISGCLLVLNYDFPVMQELFGRHAIYMDFSSDRVDRVYKPNEQAFWDDEAKRLLSELRRDRSLWAKTTARKEWTPKKLWPEFESLLYLPPKGENE